MNDNDLDAELDAYLDDFDAELDSYTEPHEQPAIDKLDEAKVNAMLAKRARLLDERARVQQRATERIEPILLWRDDRVSGIDSQLAWLDRGLEGFARQVIPTMKRRSLPFVHGTLQLTAPGAASVDVTDVGEFVAWATDDEHPERDELLRRTVDVAKTPLKQACKLGPRDDDSCTDDVEVFFAVDDCGTKVPGVRFTKPAVDRFTVTPAT